MVYVVLRILVIAILFVELLHGDYQSVFYCLLSLLLFLLPPFLERSLRIDLPSTLEIIILLFIFAAEILGELNRYFLTVPYWDTMLHTVNGFLCAAVGFSLADILNRNNKTQFSLSPLYIAIVAFCFSMTVGVLWEFFEYGADRFLHLDMQKDTVIRSIVSVALNPDHQNVPVIIDGITEVTVNGVPFGVDGYLDIGLIDTMKDLIVNFIGAAVFSAIGYSYIKTCGKGKFARCFIPKLRQEKTKEE